MTLNRRRFAFGAMAAPLGLALSGRAFAEDDYPNRPVSIVVPFGAGTGPDTVARVIANGLSENMSKRFIVENKVGASGAIGAQAVARAQPDGYTLLLGTNTTQAANLKLLKNPGYDPIANFASIARVGDFPLMLVVPSSMPTKTFKEFIAYAKQNPGKLTWGSANSATQLCGTSMQKATGIDVLHVPYKSSALVLQDILGGNISFMFVDLATGLAHVQSGKLRVLASASRERPSLLPEVATLHEEGLTDFDIASWAALYAPAKTPSAICERLSAEVRKVLGAKDVKDKFAAIGFSVSSSSAAELDQFAKREVVKWSKLIEEAGLQAQ